MAKATEQRLRAIEERAAPKRVLAAQIDAAWWTKDVAEEVADILERAGALEDVVRWQSRG